MAWSQSTRKQQRVTVTGVDRDGSCVEAITLATSFKPDPPSEGLAFDRPMTVDAIIESGVTRRVEQSSPEFEPLRREVAGHFRTAITKAPLRRPGIEYGEMGAEVLALARADKLTDETVVVQACSGIHDSPCTSSKQSANVARFRPTSATSFRTAAGSGGTQPPH